MEEKAGETIPNADLWLATAIEEHGDNLLRLCFLYLKDRHLAEDAVQDTFLKAYCSYGQFRGRCALKTWLTRIAINVCKSYLRSPWRRLSPVAELREEAYAEQFRDDTVLRTVTGLSTKYREVILLYYYQEFSCREIAQILHLTESAVTARLSRARAQLKLQLKGWYFDEPAEETP